MTDGVSTFDGKETPLAHVIVLKASYSDNFHQILSLIGAPLPSLAGEHGTSRKAHSVKMGTTEVEGQ